MGREKGWRREAEREVWRLLGLALTIAGSTGTAWCICLQNQRRLVLLKQMKEIFENLKYYISYQKAAMPEALWRLAERTRPPFGGAFEEISRQVQEDGTGFEHLWKEQVGEALKDTALKEGDRKLLLEFPSYLGYMEENAQAAALDEPVRELERIIRELEKEQKDKNKMIMSLGIAGGFFLVILLL